MLSTQNIHLEVSNALSLPILSLSLPPRTLSPSPPLRDPPQLLHPAIGNKNPYCIKPSRGNNNRDLVDQGVSAIGGCLHLIPRSNHASHRSRRKGHVNLIDIRGDEGRGLNRSCLGGNGGHDMRGLGKEKTKVDGLWWQSDWRRRHRVEEGDAQGGSDTCEGKRDGCIAFQLCRISSIIAFE